MTQPTKAFASQADLADKVIKNVSRRVTKPAATPVQPREGGSTAAN